MVCGTIASIFWQNFVDVVGADLIGGLACLYLTLVMGAVSDNQALNTRPVVSLV